MSKLTLTINADSNEDLKDQLRAFLGENAAAAALTKPAKAESKKAAAPQEAQKVESAGTAAEEKSGQPGLTVDDLRKVALDVNPDGAKKSDIKKILAEHAVERITDLDPKDFETVLKKLEALKEVKKEDDFM